MKKTILFAAAVAAGTAAVIYFMRKSKAPTMRAEREAEKRSHHITDVFAKAKI